MDSRDRVSSHRNTRALFNKSRPVAAFTRVYFCREHVRRPSVSVLGYHDSRDIGAKRTRYVANQAFAPVVERSHDGL